MCESKIGFIHSKYEKVVKLLLQRNEKMPFLNESFVITSATGPVHDKWWCFLKEGHLVQRTCSKESMYGAYRVGKRKKIVLKYKNPSTSIQRTSLMKKCHYGRYTNALTITTVYCKESVPLRIGYLPLSLLQVLLIYSFCMQPIK